MERVEGRMPSTRERTWLTNLLGDETLHLGLGEFAQQGGGEGAAHGEGVDRTGTGTDFGLGVGVDVT